MANLLDKIKGLLAKPKPRALTRAEEEQLRLDFQSRYHDFRLLLAANNRVLELMAELDAASGGENVFGMPFVRARCAAISAGVYTMVKRLDALAPEKYQGLYERFRLINGQIEQKLAAHETQREVEPVAALSLLDKDWADRVGGKMANLGEVANRVGMPTPPGFAITVNAYHEFFDYNRLQEEIDRRITKAVFESTDQLFALSSHLQQLIVSANIPPRVAEAIEAAYARLEKQTHPGVTVALRSSALGEDEADTSFAGQYRSQLNVRAEHLLDVYKEVLASKYTPQAMHYRFERGLRDSDIAMCVGCLAMVEAESGGVAYSKNPLDAGDGTLRVASAWGLPKGVVDGNAPADLFVISRGPEPEVLDRSISHKDSRYDCYAEEGVCRLDTTGEQADLPSISNEQAIEIARMCLRLEEHYGLAQDVEWVLGRDRSLKLLQARPLKPSSAPARAVESGEDAQGALIKGGVTVSPGAASGEVFWVKKDSDALGFPKGGVLVLDQPWPRWAALLGRASAVAARRGTVAGHLATVAREFGVPAVFNLGDAVEALAQGMLITVDANAPAVYSGENQQALRHAKPKPNLMKGSPVHKILKNVLAHISPLTLTDPDSKEFRPKNVQTFHDITRFCHEKSVQEMFDFGKSQNFPARSSKQLHHQVPMQYWVINLDDGFYEEVEGKYVKLDNIACKPMLALWEGMIAVPWDGPPAMSGKGFASVMFQATTNPGLASPLKASMANRNYFLISKYFVNMQSRFGFHFNTIEAMAGERPAENYISFALSGGAADAARKNARAVFVGDILEERGFNISIREDNLRARVEGEQAPWILARLRSLGYLLMHTRQLDMIMADQRVVARHRNKITQDLDALQ